MIGPGVCPRRRALLTSAKMTNPAKTRASNPATGISCNGISMVPASKRFAAL